MRVRLVIALAIVALAAPAFGEMNLDFFGNLDGDFIMSPVLFDGPITGGDLAPGFWSISVPDGAWPTNPLERGNFIWNNFYAPNYDPTIPGWVGYFDVAHGLPEMSTLFLDHTDVGTMRGVCSIEITVVDDNANGILDPDEGCAGSLSGLVIIIRAGTGLYDGMCGDGYYFGTYEKECPDSLEHWFLMMHVDIEDCSTPVEDSTWGTIKSLYR